MSKPKIRFSKKTGVLGVLLLLGFMSLALLDSVVYGSMPADAASSDISKSYYGDSATLVPGSLVSLKTGVNNRVVLANANSGNSLIGVATRTDDSLIAINHQNGKVQVSLSGQANAFVSTVYGDIKTGDQIAETFISGVGAKARPGDKVVGVAQQDFSYAGGQGKLYQHIKLSDTKSVNVAIGTIPIMVAVSRSGDGGINYVQKIATSIAGKKVSWTRIALSFVIAIVMISAVVVMIYSSIKSSITATSRNPLAKASIFESLAQVMTMVALVCIVGVLTMYLVIRV